MGLLGARMLQKAGHGGRCVVTRLLKHQQGPIAFAGEAKQSTKRRCAL